MRKHAQQTELPFVIDKVASRTQIRQMDRITDVSDRLKKVDFDLIRIRPEFNHRIKSSSISEEDYEKELEISDLANAMYKSCGPHDPIIGDILPDGTFIVNEGERRYRAIRCLLEQGLDTYPDENPVRIVTVMLNPPGYTEKDRFIRHFTSQNKKKLKPMEVAFSCLRLKEEFSSSNDDIANYYGCSRQWVDNQILLTSLSAEIQKRINEGTIAATVALQEHRKNKKEAKDKAGLLDAIDPTPFDKKEIVDDEDLFVQDNSISSPASRLKEDAGSGALVYNEEESLIWGRALRMIAGFTDQDKPIEFIVGELKANFQILNRK